MALRIASKIVGYEVESNTAPAVTDTESAKAASSVPELQSVPRSAETTAEPVVAAAPPAASPLAERMEPVLVEMSENVERPEHLRGTTYKIKTPVSEHAMYVTINDMVLNEGTAHESRQPFEIFINSKNLEHYQWIVALTRVISAVFRKGGDVAFLAEEMQAVFDPKGGYWQKGKYMPSLVAELGSVLHRHMQELGMIKPSERALAARALIADKKAQSSNVVKLQPTATPEPAEAIPPHSSGGTSASTATQTCPECGFGGLINSGGCTVCTDCGYSKCS